MMVYEILNEKEIDDLRSPVRVLRRGVLELEIDGGLVTEIGAQNARVMLTDLKKKHPDKNWQTKVTERGLLIQRVK